MLYFAVLLNCTANRKECLTCQCALCTMCLYQHHSCRSSSCQRSSPPGCRSTVGLQAGSLPSNSSSPPPGPATRTSDCHLQQYTRQSVTTAAAWWLQCQSTSSSGSRSWVILGAFHYIRFTGFILKWEKLWKGTDKFWIQKFRHPALSEAYLIWDMSKYKWEK